MKNRKIRLYRYLIKKISAQNRVCTNFITLKKQNPYDISITFGETKRRLKDRFNEHRRTVDNSNNTSRPTTVSEHFLSNPNHTATDMQLIPIEKIVSSETSFVKLEKQLSLTTSNRGQEAEVARRQNYKLVCSARSVR